MTAFKWAGFWAALAVLILVVNTIMGESGGVAFWFCLGVAHFFTGVGAIIAAIKNQASALPTITFVNRLPEEEQ